MDQEQPARLSLDQIREQGARDRAARETAEAQLRRLLDVSLIGVCTCDLEGRVLEANDAFLRLLGSSRDELRALSLDLIELTPPRMREMARHLRQLVVEKGELPPSEIELTRSDGQIAPVLISGARLPNRRAVVIFAQDLSESRRKDAALRTAEARLSLLLEAAPLILFQLDGDGAISLSRNPLHPSLTGVGEALLSQWPLQEALAALGQRALKGEEVRARIEIPNHTLEAILRPQRARPGAEVSSVLAVAVDSTEEERAAEERQRLQDWLAKEHKLDSVGLLATGLAHAFNNLLAGMLANASVVRQTLPPDHPSGGALDDVLSAASRAAALARQLLQTAVPAQSESRSLELSEQIREMAPLLVAAVPRPVRLELRLAEALPRVRTHPDQLRRALVPLVMGAIEATASKGELIRVSTNLCQIDAASEGMVGGDRLEAGWYVRLEVIDDGPALDEVALQELGDPSSGSLSRGVSHGRALGFAAVLGSMRAQSGSVRIGRGDNGVGTRVELLYPVSNTPAAHRPLRAPEGAAPSREVLVVDDDPVIRRATCRILHEMSLTVSEAATGDEALERLRSGATTPGLVLLDFAMPGMNGEQTLRAMKRLRPELRVVLCSGYTQEEATWRIDPSALCGFLAKPFTASELQSAVKSALEGISSAPAATEIQQ